MRILFIGPRYHSNQAQMMEYLVRKGHQVEFFSIKIGSSEDYRVVVPKIMPPSRFFEKKETRAYTRFIPDASMLFSMIRSFRPSAIVLRGAYSPIYSWLVIPYAIARRIRIVFYTQGPKRVKKLILARKILDRFFTGALGVSWYTPVLEKLTEGPGHKTALGYITFLPFFIEKKEIADRARHEGGKLRILCVGKYEKRKNQVLLAEAAAILARRGYSFFLTFIGSTGTKEREGYYRDLVGTLKDLGLEKSSLVLKNEDYSEMRRHYLLNDVFILPSVREEASVSQLEAMSYGLAVICSRDNGTAHYIEDGVNGFLIDITLESIVRSLERYLRNPTLVDEHGRKGAQSIGETYSIDASYEIFMNLIGGSGKSELRR